jgi:hypothetical protein
MRVSGFELLGRTFQSVPGNVQKNKITKKGERTNEDKNKHFRNVTDKLSLQFFWGGGAFAKLRGTNLSSFMSVCRSAWNNSDTTGRIFMKFGI